MRRLGSLALIGALLSGCSGGRDDDDDLPPPKVTRLLFDMTDICAAEVPSPTDLFRDEEGKSELSACAGPSDPIERELFLAQLDEGAPLTSEIVIPIDAKIKVQKPKMFAVTAEKPGGVVVSPLEKVMAVAKVAA